VNLKIAGPCLALMNKNYEASTGVSLPGLAPVLPRQE